MKKPDFHDSLLLIVVALLAYGLFIRSPQLRFQPYGEVFLYDAITGRVCDPRAPGAHTIAKSEESLAWSKQFKKKEYPPGFVPSIPVTDFPPVEPPKLPDGTVFYPIGEARTRWSAFWSWSNEDLRRELEIPENFRAAFPEHSSLDESAIKELFSSADRVGFSPQDLIDALELGNKRDEHDKLLHPSEYPLCTEL